jgi:purine catabolism regulator
MDHSGAMWREIDVASVVGALDQEHTPVVLGEGAHRWVRRARVVADPDEVHTAMLHDLVVTTPEVLAAAGPPEAVVAALVAADVAGIVLARTPDGPELAPFVDVAGRQALPVVALPEAVSLADASALVLDAVLDAQLAAQLDSAARPAADTDAEARFAALSLEELVSGRTRADEVAERATSLGWDLHRPRAVLLASIDAPVERRVLPTAVASIAAAARATLGAQAIVWTRTTSVAALLPIDTDDSTQRRRLADALRDELDARVRSVSVSIGVGRTVHGPEALSRSYVEAARAVDVGRWARGRHVVEVFDELGLERLLAAVPREELGEFVRHTIGPLLDHDAAQGTDLADTLAMWLETRNMAEAARRTFVHYNTMKNRLERVEAILGPVLADATRALECEVALHIARHYDVTG